MRIKTKRIKTIKVKPLSLSPTHASPLHNTPLRGKSLLQQPISRPRIEQPVHTPGSTLPDAGNQPDPTPEKIQQYKENANKIVNDTVISSLRKHKKTDTFHGSRSLRMILGKEIFGRKVNDYDVFSKNEKQRAIELEAELDRKAGCDLFSTRYEHIKKVSIGEDDPYTGEHLYIVESKKVKDDPTIDVMSHPKDLPRILKNDIYHEALPVAYQKAKTRVYRSPLNAGKAVHDYRAIEEYYRRKGKKMR